MTPGKRDVSPISRETAVLDQSDRKTLRLPSERKGSAVENSVTPSRIKGVTVRTVVSGRQVTVVFRSPYRWRIYDGGADVTREFGHSCRGETLPAHSEAWHRFHAETASNEVDCLLHI